MCPSHLPLQEGSNPSLSADPAHRVGPRFIRAKWQPSFSATSSGIAASNARKHGVSFEEASTVFADTDYLLTADTSSPDRFLVIGTSAFARVLTGRPRRARTAHSHHFRPESNEA